jgi:hypothetical protein
MKEERGELMVSPVPQTIIFHRRRASIRASLCFPDKIGGPCRVHFNKFFLRSPSLHFHIRPTFEHQPRLLVSYHSNFIPSGMFRYDEQS